MATVNGSVGGTPVRFTNQSSNAASLAQSVLAAATVAPVTGSLTLGTGNTYFAATGTQPSTVSGGATITIGVLSGQNTVFNTGNSVASAIVAGDNTNSGIINNNPSGSLVAFTGAGGNALSGQGLINGFQTGIGGQDAVAFAAPTAGNLQVNSLTSLGQDTVSIFGPANGGTQANAITALGNGQDNVTLNNGASLNFVNLSTATSTITASTGSTVTVGGTGATLVQDAGNGNETFNINTAAGNVTLVGSANGGADTYNFVKLSQTASTAVDVVANFDANDRVNLGGYAPNSYAANVVNGSTVLTLSDNTQIVFAGVSNATQVTSRIG